MAKKKRISKEVQRLKRNLQARIRRYNKGLILKGVDESELFSTSVKDIRTKKDFAKKSKEFEKTKADELVITKQGLHIRQSQIDKLNKTREKANTTIRDAVTNRKTKREQIKKALYGEAFQPSSKTDDVARTYDKHADDFKTLKEFTAYIDRMQEVTEQGVKGAWGQDLKDRLLKAIRGEVYRPPNGYAIDADGSGLAEFIEKHVTPDMVEVLFEGNLNFTFVYGYEHHNVKELVLAHDLIMETSLRDLYVNEGYAERFEDYLDGQLSVIDDELKDDVLDRFEDYSEVLK